MVSIEEDCSVNLGSVSPRSCHRIFGFNTARFFFLPVFRPFHTVEIFMAYSFVLVYETVLRVINRRRCRFTIGADDLLSGGGKTVPQEIGA